MPLTAAAEAAWTRLLRVGRSALERVEADLKDGGWPPLAWYDVLLELERAKPSRLTAGELERVLLLRQYNLSRMLDRMEAAGLVRRRDHPEDRRRRWIEPADEGLALRRAMWPAYAAAIQQHVGSRLTADEANTLADLLDRLR